MRPSTEDEFVSNVTIGVGRVAHCDLCNTCLRDGHHVEILVTIDGTRVGIAVTRCKMCARGRIRPETERACLLARGKVCEVVRATGRSYLIVSGASVIDRS